MAVLARSGCTTVADHHYVFPQGSGDIVGAIVDAVAAHRRAASCHARIDGPRRVAGRTAARTSPSRRPDAALAASRARPSSATTMPRSSSMVRVAIAPCSPFSVTADLLREAAVLARSLGVRLHTHASETVEEDEFCLERFGMTPDAVPRVGRVARRRRVDGALRAPRRLRDREICRDRHGRRTLPVSNARSPRASPRCATCCARACRSASASTGPRRTSPGSWASRSARRC